MNTILLATDADWLADEVSAALLDATTKVSRVKGGRGISAVVAEVSPELIVLDMQMGSQGGVATCLNLRQDMETARLPETPILLLLDRQADVFLARESQADAWLVKPLNPLQLKRQAEGLLAGAGREAASGNGSAITSNSAAES